MSCYFLGPPNSHQVYMYPVSPHAQGNLYTPDPTLIPSNQVGTIR